MEFPKEPFGASRIPIPSGAQVSVNGQNVGGYAFSFHPVDQIAIQRVIDFIRNETGMVVVNLSIEQTHNDFALVTFKCGARAATQEQA